MSCRLGPRLSHSPSPATQLSYPLIEYEPSTFQPSEARLLSWRSRRRAVITILFYLIFDFSIGYQYSALDYLFCRPLVHSLEIDNSVYKFAEAIIAYTPQLRKQVSLTLRNCVIYCCVHGVEIKKFCRHSHCCFPVSYTHLTLPTILRV